VNFNHISKFVILGRGSTVWLPGTWLALHSIPDLSLCHCRLYLASPCPTWLSDVCITCLANNVQISLSSSHLYIDNWSNRQRLSYVATKKHTFRMSVFIIRLQHLYRMLSSSDIQISFPPHPKYLFIGTKSDCVPIWKKWAWVCLMQETVKVCKQLTLEVDLSGEWR
jgi:hypothetical protein